MTGIYTEENRVIHFTRTQDHENNNNNIVGESSNGGGRCGECGYDAAEQKGVVKTCLDCFLKGHALYRFDYNVSSEHLLLKRSGTCSTGPCDEPDVVVRRATEMLESGGGFGDYDILDNNCEAFAMYCKTGQRVSLQAVSKRAQVKIACKAFTSKPFSISNVCEAIGQIAVGHRLDMLAIDKSVHGDQIDEDDDDEERQ